MVDVSHDGNDRSARDLDIVRIRSDQLFEFLLDDHFLERDETDFVTELRAEFDRHFFADRLVERRENAFLHQKLHDVARRHAERFGKFADGRAFGQAGLFETRSLGFSDLIENALFDRARARRSEISFLESAFFIKFLIALLAARTAEFFARVVRRRVNGKRGRALARRAAKLGLAARGGTLVAYGAAPSTASLEIKPFDIYSKELNIVGSYAGTYAAWPEAIALIQGGRFDPEQIVTEVVPLADVVGAIETVEKNKDVIKIQIQP